MPKLLIAIAAAGLMSLTAAAQTNGSANSSASGGANVQAGQSAASANANPNSSAALGAEKGNGRAAGVESNTGASLTGGTTIPATLNKSVDARKAKSGEEVTAKTTQEVRSASGMVIPKGSKLIGHVTDAKARAKGDSESALGIAFDHAVLKDGRELPFHANIQALAAAANNMPAQLGDDSIAGANAGATGGASAPMGGRGTGGVLGGVGNTAGGVANTAGNTVGAVNSTTGGVVNSTTGEVGPTGQLSSSSTGVIGLNGLQLSSAGSNSTQGSLITSSGKDVKLDSGTRMVLQVVQ